MAQITVNSVTATAEQDVVIVNAIIDGETLDYVLRPDDPYGLAPDLREAIKDHEILPVPEPPPAPVPNVVSSRQFKLQLLAAGLLDQVEAWIRSQDQAVQIAYDNSGTFVRTEPMMQSGFAALGFTSEQIDAFFTAAAAL